MPVVFCCIADVTVFLAVSSGHKTFPTPVLTKLSHESRVLVTALNHFFIVLPVVVRTPPDDELDVLVPLLVAVVLVPLVVEVVVPVLDDVEPLVDVPLVLVVVVVLVLVEEVVPVFDVDVEPVEAVVPDELTILLSCCQKPDPNEDIQPESARPESSGRTILISGKFERLATISSICRWYQSMTKLGNVRILLI